MDDRGAPFQLTDRGPGRCGLRLHHGPGEFGCRKLLPGFWNQFHTRPTVWVHPGAANGFGQCRAGDAFRPQGMAKGFQVHGQRLDQDRLHRRPHGRRPGRELVEIGGKTFRGIAARTGHGVGQQQEVLGPALQGFDIVRVGWRRRALGWIQNAIEFVGCALDGGNLAGWPSGTKLSIVLA